MIITDELVAQTKAAMLKVDREFVGSDQQLFEAMARAALAVVVTEIVGQCADIAKADADDAEARMSDANPQIGAALLHVYSTGKRIESSIRSLVG